MFTLLWYIYIYISETDTNILITAVWCHFTEYMFIVDTENVFAQQVFSQTGTMRLCPTKISLGTHFSSPMGPKTLLYVKSQCYYNMKGLKFG